LSDLSNWNWWVLEYNMKAQTKLATTGLLGILLLSGLGTVYVLTKEQLPFTYICPANNVTGIFDRLSSTNKTGYWTVNGTSKSSVCTNSAWITLTEWCKINKIDCKQFTEEGMITNPELPPDVYDETGAEIITTSTITIDKTKTINVNGTILTIDYKPITVIKCICEKTIGCKIKECI
jgi:hypothetical protein